MATFASCPSARSGLRWSWGKKSPVKIEISGGAALREATIAGSGGIRVDRIAGPSFKGTIAGSGDLNLAAIDANSAESTIAGVGRHSRRRSRGQAVARHRRIGRHRCPRAAQRCRRHHHRRIGQHPRLCQPHGDVYEAVVTGVMPFGLFAALKRFGIEGLVRVRNLDDDYYVHDEQTKSFRGRHSKKVYRLGDPIYVRVIRVDELRSEVDMDIISEREFLADGGGKAISEEPIDSKFEGGADEGGGMGTRVGTRSTKNRPAAKADTPMRHDSNSQPKRGRLCQERPTAVKQADAAEGEEGWTEAQTPAGKKRGGKQSGTSGGTKKSNPGEA